MERIQVQVRWLVKPDVPAVLAIERESFFVPWDEADFRAYHRQHNMTLMVAEAGETILGFMVFEICDKSLHLVNIAVALPFRRMGVGVQLLEMLKGKLSTGGKRHLLTIAVAERNLGGQYFLKSQGFRAIDILPDATDGKIVGGDEDDAIVFAYSAKGGLEWVGPVNRISQLGEL